MKSLSKFDTARNLMFFSWNNWRFMQVAEKHAYSSVEMALREKLGHPRRGNRLLTLQPLLKRAMTLGLISDSGFRNYQRLRVQQAEVAKRYQKLLGESYRPPAPTPALSYTKGMVSHVAAVRNELAHGSTMLHP